MDSESIIVVSVCLYVLIACVTHCLSSPMHSQAYRSSVNFFRGHKIFAISKMSEFYMILARKIIKIPEFFMIFARKIYKIPEFCMIFARKCQNFT